MRRSWLMLAVTPLLLAGTGHVDARALVPVALLLSGVFAAQRSVRLRLYFEQLRVVSLLGFGTLPGVLVAGGVAPALFGALFLTSALMTTGVASEFSEGTASTWLTSPQPVRRLLLERVVPGLGVGASLAATLVLGSRERVPLELVWPLVAVLLAGLPLVFALLVKEPFKAALGLVILASWGLERAWHGLLVVALSVVALVGVLVRPRALLTYSLPVSLPRTSLGVGRRTALAAMVRKELKLQRYSFMLVPVMAVVWAFGELGTLASELFFCGLLVGAVAGITAIVEERQSATAWCDVAAISARLAWRVKCAVTFGVAMTVGVLVPAMLLAVRPGVSVEASGFVATPWVLLELLGFATVVAVATALGLVCASLTRDVVRAFVGALSMALLSLIVFAVAMGVLGMTLAGVGHLPMVLDDARVTRVLVFATQVLPALVMVGVYASVARRAWLVGALPGAALARAVGVIAAGSLLSGVLREAVSQLSTH